MGYTFGLPPPDWASRMETAGAAAKQPPLPVVTSGVQKLPPLAQRPARPLPPTLAQKLESEVHALQPGSIDFNEKCVALQTKSADAARNKKITNDDINKLLQSIGAKIDQNEKSLETFFPNEKINTIDDTEFGDLSPVSPGDQPQTNEESIDNQLKDMENDSTKISRSTIDSCLDDINGLKSEITDPGSKKREYVDRLNELQKQLTSARPRAKAITAKTSETSPTGSRPRATAMSKTSKMSSRTEWEYDATTGKNKQKQAPFVEIKDETPQGSLLDPRIDVTGNKDARVTTERKGGEGVTVIRHGPTGPDATIDKQLKAMETGTTKISTSTIHSCLDDINALAGGITQKNKDEFLKRLNKLQVQFKDAGFKTSAPTPTLHKTATSSTGLLTAWNKFTSSLSRASKSNAAAGAPQADANVKSKKTLGQFFGGLVKKHKRLK